MGYAGRCIPPPPLAQRTHFCECLFVYHCATQASWCTFNPTFNENKTFFALPQLFLFFFLRSTSYLHPFYVMSIFLINLYNHFNCKYMNSLQYPMAKKPMNLLEGGYMSVSQGGAMHYNSVLP